MTTQIERGYPAVPASVREAREDLVALARRASASPEQLDAIRLAISEAATNVVKYAYGGGCGIMHITAALSAGELTVVIRDDGCGLRTCPDEPGLGWGLPLISECGRTFALSERAEGGTEVRIQFALG